MSVDTLEEVKTYGIIYWTADGQEHVHGTYCSDRMRDEFIQFSTSEEAMFALNSANGILHAQAMKYTKAHIVTLKTDNAAREDAKHPVLTLLLQWVAPENK